MGHVKREAENMRDTLIDRMHEMAQDAWCDMSDTIEDRKDETRDMIMAEFQEARVQNAFMDVSYEDLLEILGEDLEDLVTEAIYYEWEC